MNNIPTNLSVASMLPNDPKVWVKNKSELVSLGASNYKAFIYYEGMRVYCAENKEIWEWREELIPGETGGLVASQFTYPAGLNINNIDYGGRKFNFFKVLTPEDVAGGLQTYQVANTTGAGQGLYKDTTIPALNTKQFNFKTITAAPGEGTGTSLIKDITSNANEVSINILTLDTDSLLFDTSTPGKLKINIPSTTSIPAIIVNNAYVPSYTDWVKAGGNLISNPSFVYKGEGTMAKPFTNSINYTSTVAYTITADTAIQNVLDYYIGVGTRLNPTHGNKIIEVYPGNAFYTFKGDISCHSMKLYIKQGTFLVSNPDNDWFLDYDNPLYFTNLTPVSQTFVIEQDAYIYLNKNGFRNSGTNVPTNTFATSKGFSIIGQGQIAQTSGIELGDTPGDYVIFSLNEGELNYGNDGGALIDCRNIIVRSNINPIVKQGKRVSDFKSVEFSYGRINFDIDPAVSPFEFFGGSYVRTENCKFYWFGNQTTITGINIYGQNTLVNLFRPIFNGTLDNLINVDCQSNANYLLDSAVSIIESLYVDGITVTNLIKATFPGGRTNKYQKAYINGSYFSKGLIDDTKIDMTGGNNSSCTYYVGRQADYGRQIVEHLTRFPSRAAAALILEPGARFINTNGLPITPSDPSFYLDIVI